MRPSKNQSGFTLVELLIVVAIIGTLAQIGIPSFRQMIAKAKQSEAKANLGAIYTAEAAFNSEFGFYGENLKFMGYEPDGELNYYSVGFPDNECRAPGEPPSFPQPYQHIVYTVEDDGSLTPQWIPEILELQKKLQATSPAYYSGGRTVYRRTDLAGKGFCYRGSVRSDFGTFVASASGPLNPNINPSSATTEQSDQWTINQARVLRNVQYVPTPPDPKKDD